MSAIITISFYVPPGFVPGDYVKLYGDNGSGEIDWDTPLIDSPLDLFPDGKGVFGFGHTPFGSTPFGKQYPIGVAGFGNFPFGHSPFGIGGVKISASVTIYESGTYKFAFASFDSAGNRHSGSPEEIEVEVCIAPLSPAGLRPNSYDKDTDVLVLDAL